MFLANLKGMRVVLLSLTFLMASASLRLFAARLDEQIAALPVPASNELVTDLLAHIHVTHVPEALRLLVLTHRLPAEKLASLLESSLSLPQKSILLEGMVRRTTWSSAELQALRQTVVLPTQNLPTLPESITPALSYFLTLNLQFIEKNALYRQNPRDLERWLRAASHFSSSSTAYVLYQKIIEKNAGSFPARFSDILEYFKLTTSFEWQVSHPDEAKSNYRLLLGIFRSHLNQLTSSEKHNLNYHLKSFDIKNLIRRYGELRVHPLQDDFSRIRAAGSPRSALYWLVKACQSFRQRPQ